MSERHSVADILACGCEPEIECCSHCDGLRAENARLERAVEVAGSKENWSREALLMAIEDERRLRAALAVFADQANWGDGAYPHESPSVWWEGKDAKPWTLAQEALGQP